MTEEILKLKKELERLKKSIKKQKYGLVWMDVPEAFEDDVEDKLPILKEVPDLAIKNDDGKPTHILIEGDNYHALTCLNYTHKGKIDIIYIDPPYNTGSDGFRYKDKRVIDKFPDGAEVPKDHPFRHSYWLSFMRKRLELAQSLLAPKGVIFISIDDNEFAQLKLLCDDVFLESSLLGILTWQNKTKPVNSGKARYQIQQNVEYILCYSNRLSRDKFPGFLLKTEGERKYNYKTEFGMARLVDIEDSDRGRKKRETMKFPIFGIKPGPGKRWKIGKDEVQKLIEQKKLIKIDGKIKRIIYPEDESNEIERPFWSLLTAEKVGTAEEGKRELSEILGKNHNFDTVKPTRLIEELLLHLKKDAIVLDFFAGTGTTGHAVMKKNCEGNQRQFILITDNENEIMKKLCYPRLKKVMNGFKDYKKLGHSLKYYKTAFIGKNNILDATDSDKVELAHNAGELLSIAENTLELVKQNKYYQLFEDKNKEKYTSVYFREELDKFEDFVEMVAKLKKKTAIYVFSWGNEEFSEEFDHIKDVRVKTIPQPILEIYKNIYNLGA